MSEMKNFSYETRTNILHAALELIDEKQLSDSCKFPWYNQTLCQVNESVVRLGVMQGEYHWHKHDNDDEFFFVLEGLFLIDLEPEADGVTPGKVVELGPREGYVVPKGIIHRTRAPKRSIILMVENAGIIPTGDN